MKKPLAMAHDFLAEVLTPDSVVVDATMGQGFDTVFLAKKAGKVYAFDVQKQALVWTQERLARENLVANLIHAGHEQVANYVKEKIDGAIFNLGYLPRADKSLTTQPKTTLLALEQILERLSFGGRISIMVYYGHEGGQREKDSLLDFVSRLPQKDFAVMSYQALNQINQPPFLIMIEKLGKAK
ncbi:class I SAM-dependent methyltransferase [Streptococcus sp. sy004]|uniref:tRNA (mnm(5)s(2)U34)-methyltransferase n=1 Tax=Streptococcus sp. sy004 TaxID=2600149 RepID=UPI0011B7FCED|nr:class I SAM-dependent methyltransferase [Streptococcus sp. sy004]TWT09889.1 16S rRNA (cytosine(1402)-N(4))-methyltransferase [Streptococcus sp. sy004]